MSPLQLCLIFSSLLFSIGLVGALSRSNTLLTLAWLRHGPLPLSKREGGARRRRRSG